MRKYLLMFFPLIVILSGCNKNSETQSSNYPPDSTLSSLPDSGNYNDIMQSNYNNAMQVNSNGTATIKMVNKKKGYIIIANGKFEAHNLVCFKGFDQNHNIFIMQKCKIDNGKLFAMFNQEMMTSYFNFQKQLKSTS